MKRILSILRYVHTKYNSAPYIIQHNMHFSRNILNVTLIYRADAYVIYRVVANVYSVANITKIQYDDTGYYDSSDLPSLPNSVVHDIYGGMLNSKHLMEMLRR